MTRRLTSRGFAAVSVVTACLNGCSFADVSRPSVDPLSGWSTELAGRGQRIVGPGLDIYVKASNRVSSAEDETKRDTFGVSLYFEFSPKVGHAEFAPGEVTL